MAAASPMQSASSDAPDLTVGTTAPTSPSPLSPPSGARSPSLSPLPPDSSSFTKKRKAPSSDSKTTKKVKAAANKPKATPKSTPAKGKAASKATPKSAAKGASSKSAKEDKADEKPEKGTYCHQCRTKVEPENVLRCTKLRKYTKSTPPRACNLAWCERDLRKRYEVDLEAVRERGHDDVSEAELAKHDTTKEYIWACPCCLDECQNSTCRIKKGLEPLGDVVKLAAEKGVTPLELVAEINANGPQPTTKSRVDMFDMIDGDLSDPDAPGGSKPKAKKAAAAPAKKAATKAKEKAPAKKGVATKATAPAKKETKKAAPAPKAKAPPRFVWPKEDPPVIANVETRMSREEVEQRMYLREFVCRFRTVLGLPDRSLGPLDDFDHPLSEAAVRQIGGALLGVIANVGISQHYTGGDVPDIIPEIDDLREEMRYADLARFASIYQQAAELLDLTLPPDPTLAAKERNEKAMRALLDLGADEPAPSWALESGGVGVSTRRGASRLPAASEVVRMLLALCEHVTHHDIVRFHMDPAVAYSAGDAIKAMSTEQKAEAKRWEAEKAKLNAARVRAKNAAETKAARAKLEEAQQNHIMLTRLPALDYRAGLGRKAMRFEPLGTDLDGRVYYSLTARQIEEERYRPAFWARGVFIFGKGWGVDGDDAPALVERWMVVNTGPELRQLGKYLAYRWRTRVDEMEQEVEKEKGKKGKGKAGSGRNTPNGRATPKTTKKTKVDKQEEEYDSDDSELSSPPEDFSELLSFLDPPGYTPSAEKIKDDQFKLEQAVGDVATFVEALEWKGIRA